MTETATPAPRRPLLTVLRPVLIAGLVIAAIRLLLDATLPDHAVYVGVYFLMPVVLLVCGIRGTLDEIRWPRFLLAMFVTALFVWGLANFVAYSVGFTAGWTHGRFAPLPDRPLPESTGGRILTALVLACITTLPGTVWLTVWGTLLAWLPGRIRRNRAGARTAEGSPT